MGATQNPAGKIELMLADSRSKNSSCSTSRSVDMRRTASVYEESKIPSRMTEPVTPRLVIEQMWRDFLEGRRSKEDVTAWGQRTAASLVGVHIMEEIGLQQLAGTSRGLTVTGEL